jgi:calcium permeable stress-gated cation channel
LPAITYSVISPIINGLAFVTFVFFYFLWKYLFIWQLDQPRAGDSGGLFYPKAIHHVFVGLYLQQICLAALFFLARDENQKASAIPEGVLMIVLIAVTVRSMELAFRRKTSNINLVTQIFFHFTLYNSYGPLINALPLSLSNKTGALALPGPSDPKQPGEAYVASDPIGGPDDRSETYEDFAHPASVEPQQVVWIPHDTLRLCEVEEAADRAYGVDTSNQGAFMDEKGRVDVEGPPPGEDVRSL